MSIIDRKKTCKDSKFSCKILRVGASAEAQILPNRSRTEYFGRSREKASAEPKLRSYTNKNAIKRKNLVIFWGGHGNFWTKTLIKKFNGDFHQANYEKPLILCFSGLFGAKYDLKCISIMKQW